ncbi:hypothetical protein [Plantactinospora sp. B5E13]|uniref:hypothetical protein n=1 Tax=Plantactinospora sp. B5E13 TaxID=3153758 RepID=UPI00325D74C7
MNARVTGAARTRRIAATLGLASAALMATQLTLVAPAGAALPGLTRVVSTGQPDSNWKTWQAACPSDTMLIGGGGRVNRSDGQVTMDTMTPVFGATDVYSVTGREDDNAYSGDWSITATALCARPPVGWEQTESAGPWNSNSKGHTVFCPPGKQILGFGVEMNGGMGQVVVDELRPAADLSSVTITGIEDGNGYADDWQIRGEAICVSPIAGLARVSSPLGILDSERTKSATATCPDGKRVHGVGGEIDQGAGQVRMTAIEPISDTQVRVSASEDEDGYGNLWAVRAYAICA